MRARTWAHAGRFRGDAPAAARSCPVGSLLSVRRPGPPAGDLISIPVSNTSVNPARSIAAAVWGGATPLSQVWVFIVAPIVGGSVAGLVVRLGGRRRVTS